MAPTNRPADPEPGLREMRAPRRLRGIPRVILHGRARAHPRKACGDARRKEPAPPCPERARKITKHLTRRSQPAPQARRPDKGPTPPRGIKGKPINPPSRLKLRPPRNIASPYVSLPQKTANVRQRGRGPRSQERSPLRSRRCDRR